MGKILITGAAGYVGSALARLLLQRNLDVTLIDNYSTPSNIQQIENTKIIVQDIRDDIDLVEYDILFHLAAISGINRCNENAKEAASVNVGGTRNLLKTFKGRVIFASTSAVYGEAAHPVINEMHPTIPLGAYGKTKMAAEKLIRAHGDHCILRFSNIYGYGMFCKRTVTDLFIDRAIKNIGLEIHGDGRQRRDFVHIHDAVAAYWHAMKSPVVGTYNIGGNEALSVNDIAELVIKEYRNVSGYTIEKVSVPAPSGRQWKDFIYSSEEAKQALDYEPSFSVSGEIRNRLYAYSRTLRD